MSSSSATEPKLPCRTCGKPLTRSFVPFLTGAVSRVFPEHHERCIERVVAIARAETRPD